MKIMGVALLLCVGILTERFVECGWYGWLLYAVCVALGVLCVCAKEERRNG